MGRGEHWLPFFSYAFCDWIRTVVEGEGLFPGTFSGGVVPVGGKMGELFPVATRSAFWRDLLALDSAKVRYTGSRAGEGETF